MAINHALVECWCVYVQPSKKVDPRAAARATSYSINNKEMVHCNRFASPASPNTSMVFIPYSGLLVPCSVLLVPCCVCLVPCFVCLASWFDA